jgi:hypothetical protein
VGVPKSLRLELLWLCETIETFVNLRLGWGLKRSCSPCQELSNDVSHATCTQGNQVDSQLFMVGSQTTRLIPDLFFGHKLCFRCPNGSCKPILDIYVSIAFQWYKELFKARGFDPCNCSLKTRESTGTPTSNMGVHLGVWEFILTLSHFQVSLLAWPLANPYLGHEPKARVVTLSISHCYVILFMLLLLVCCYSLENLLQPPSFLLAGIGSGQELRIGNLYFFNKYLTFCFFPTSLSFFCFFLFLIFLAFGLWCKACYKLFWR